MINEGGWRDEQWPDHWTAVTADGSWSAQLFESSVYLTLDKANATHVLQMAISTSSIGVNKFLKDQLKTIIKNIVVIKSDILLNQVYLKIKGLLVDDWNNVN
ncbi:Methionine aminopeptidase 1A [Papilio machaon]|uniref:Methionine aminopeptidase 1A n=1 Tax=Papilio machaon TaxID=76193 RepID=A0A194QS84_PAPMA|nr:Methionine aminopeptidase 1A [Papilio machaon]